MRGWVLVRRILYLIFATTTLLILGLIYAWSIFARPIGAAFPEYELMLPMVFQVSLFMFCLASLVGAQIIKRISPRVAVIVAASFLCVGFISTALCASWGVWALFIFYGVFAASGCGIGYNSIVSLVNPWFPDRIGLSSGVMMMGFGIATLVFGSLANAAFAIFEWSTVFIIIAVFGTCVMLTFAFVVKPAPADIARQLGLPVTTHAIKESPTMSQNILRTKAFWYYFTWATAVVACGLALLGSAAQGAITLGINTGFAVLFVGLLSTSNSIGRVVNGAIFDRFGLIVVMRLNSIIPIIAMLGLFLAWFLQAQGISAILYVTSGLLVVFATGSAPVMGAGFSRRRFRASDFSKNFGIVTCCMAVAAVVNIIVGGFFGAPHAGNGAIIYIIFTGIATVALLSVLVFSKIYRSDLAKIDKELAELAEPAALAGN